MLRREGPGLDSPALPQIIGSDTDTDRIVGQQATEGHLNAIPEGPSLREAAIDYVSRGVPVFPLVPLGKLPVIKSAHPGGDPLNGICRGGCGHDGHGCYDATTDVDKINEWWSRWPDANIGHGCGHRYDVLDIDGYEAAMAAATFIMDRFGTEACIVGGPSVVTSRGQHHFFEPGTYTNRVALAGIKGLDWRTIGRLTALPPSVHKSGFVYRWEVSGGVVRDLDVAAEPIPRGVRALLEHKVAEPSTPPTSMSVFPTSLGRYNANGLIDAVAHADEGRRNDALNWASFKLGKDAAAGRVDADELTLILDELKIAAERVGLSTREIRATITSGLRKGRGA
jgi:hypothetical protein